MSPGVGEVKTMGMEFFCYHRDRPGSVTLRESCWKSTGPTWTGTTPAYTGTCCCDAGATRWAAPDIEVHNWQFGGRPS
jgi:hypothetical protein